MQKLGLAEMKFFGEAWRLVKLQRPPPEMRIFSPGARAWSMHQHRAPAPARLDGAHHPGRARADHHNVEILQGTPFRTVYRWLAKRRQPDKRSGERSAF